MCMCVGQERPRYVFARERRVFSVRNVHLTEAAVPMISAARRSATPARFHPRVCGDVNTLLSERQQWIQDGLTDLNLHLAARSELLCGDDDDYNKKDEQDAGVGSSG